tara:strand:- start:454 stop:1251 length:798 start_codon:yes stop_codon:yes gene_type:complete
MYQKMDKYFVVGNNSSKSLSPMIFNYWFKKYKIDAKYSFIELNDKSFNKDIKEILTKKNVSGLNITIPFKEKIIKHVDVLDEHSEVINATNCLSIGKKIKGINTDWLGYYKTLPKHLNLAKKKVVLIGYGGAAYAIHYVLKKKGFNNITIINRTKKALKFEKQAKQTQGYDRFEEIIKSAKLIINTTPINPIKNDLINRVSSDAILSDIVYSPKETSFLRNFPNNKKIYGISMLLEQAALCFKFWFGFEPVIDRNLIENLDKQIK